MAKLINKNLLEINHGPAPKLMLFYLVNRYKEPMAWSIPEFLEMSE
jgi:hypothetical protein